MRPLLPSDAYQLLEAHRRHALRATTPDLLHNSHELARAEAQTSQPILFTHAEGRKAYDLIGTTYVSLCLVSERFIALLHANDVTGWSAIPVVLTGKNQAQLPGYAGLAVHGRCGAIDPSLSEPVVLPPPRPEGMAVLGARGLLFANDSWDGSDVFTAANGAWTFVVERVRRLVSEAKLTNVEFERLSEIEWTPYTDHEVLWKNGGT